MRLPLDPVEFAVEFVQRMRRTPGLTRPPSPRQTVAIVSLLTVRLMRRGSLTLRDYVEAAVSTTYHLDQEIAREIAERLILEMLRGREKVESPHIPREIEASMPRRVTDVLERIRREIALASRLRSHHPSIELMRELERRARLGESPWSELFELLGRDSKIVVMRGISSLDELTRVVRELVSLRLGSLSPREASLCLKLGWKGLLRDSPAPWESLVAEERSRLLARLSEMLERDLELFCKSLSFLSRAGVLSREDVEALLAKLSARIRDLRDLAIAALMLGWIPPDLDVWKVVKESLSRMPAVDAFELATLIDSRLGTDFREIVLKEAASSRKLSLRELSRLCTFSALWRRLVSEEISELLSEALKSKDKFQALLNALEQVKRAADEIIIPYAKHFMLTCAKSIRVELLRNAPDARTFLTLLERMIREEREFAPSLEEVLPIARALGVPDDVVARLYGSTYEYIKYLYEHGLGDFKMLSELLRGLRLTQSQMTELLRIAATRDLRDHIAALAFHDFKAFMRAVDTLGIPEEQWVSALTAGPGEGLLRLWFTHRSEIPESARRRLRELAKRALIEVAYEHAFRQFGSAEPGVVPTNVTRIPRSPEELENVDVLETLEELVLSGKNPKYHPLALDDFRVHVCRRGRLAIVSILDISGSMAGEKLAYCAIATAVLCLKLRPEEFACALFESDTHIVKGLGEVREVEEVADTLLSLSARGGTVAAPAVRWARKQVAHTDAELKLVFMFTDCAWFDTDEALDELRNLAREDVNFVLAVPRFSYVSSVARRVLKITRGELLVLDSVDSLPDALTSVLRRLFY